MAAGLSKKPRPQMTSEETNDQGAGGNPPRFSGKEIDYPDWKEDTKIWYGITRIKQEARGGRIFLEQTDKIVKKTMRKLGNEIINSDKGYERIMEVMDEKYLRDNKTLSSKHFDAFDSMYRDRKESSGDFLGRFELGFEDAQRYELELQASPRMLTLMAMKRLHISDEDRATLMFRMANKVDLHNLSSVITAAFRNDVPWRKLRNSDLEGDDLTEQTFMVDDEEEAALYTKKFGKPKPSGIVCHRCGKIGHIASDCQMDWSKVLKIRESNGYVAFAGLATPAPDSDSGSSGDADDLDIDAGLDDTAPANPFHF